MHHLDFSPDQWQWLLRVTCRFVTVFLSLQGKGDVNWKGIWLPWCATYSSALNETYSHTGDIHRWVRSCEILRVSESDWESISDAVSLNWLRKDFNISNKKKWLDRWWNLTTTRRCTCTVDKGGEQSQGWIPNLSLSLICPQSRKWRENSYGLAE